MIKFLDFILFLLIFVMNKIDDVELVAEGEGLLISSSEEGEKSICEQSKEVAKGIDSILSKEEEAEETEWIPIRKNLVDYDNLDQEVKLVLLSELSEYIAKIDFLKGHGKSKGRDEDIKKLEGLHDEVLRLKDFFKPEEGEDRDHSLFFIATIEAANAGKHKSAYRIAEVLFFLENIEEKERNYFNYSKIKALREGLERKLENLTNKKFVDKFRASGLVRFIEEGNKKTEKARKPQNRGLAGDFVSYNFYRHITNPKREEGIRRYANVDRDYSVIITPISEENIGVFDRNGRIMEVFSSELLSKLDILAPYESECALKSATGVIDTIDWRHGEETLSSAAMFLEWLKEVADRIPLDVDPSNFLEEELHPFVKEILMMEMDALDALENKSKEDYLLCKRKFFRYLKNLFLLNKRERLSVEQMTSVIDFFVSFLPKLSQIRVGLGAVFRKLDKSGEFLPKNLDGRSHEDLIAKLELALKIYDPQKVTRLISSILVESLVVSDGELNVLYEEERKSYEKDGMIDPVLLPDSLNFLAKARENPNLHRRCVGIFQRIAEDLKKIETGLLYTEADNMEKFLNKRVLEWEKEEFNLQTFFWRVFACQEKLKETEIQPTGIDKFVSKNEEQRKLKDFWDLNLLEVISEDLGFDFSKLPMRSQLQFLDYISTASRDEMQEVIDVVRSFEVRKRGKKVDRAKERRGNEQKKLNFLISFLALEQGGKEMGDIILDLGQEPAAERIFQEYVSIIGLVQENAEYLRTRGAPVNIYESAVFKRGMGLLRDFHRSENKDFDKFLDQAKAYHREVIAWGALFKSATTDKSLTPEKLKEVFEEIRVDVFQAGSRIKDPSKMKEANNYTTADFTVADYDMVVENLRKAYVDNDVDPKWYEELKNNIPEDLNNPDVTFVMVRNEKGKLVGLCKFKPDPEDSGAYYFGTMYVEEEYQKGFSVGGYLQGLATTLMKEESKEDKKKSEEKDPKINATVAIANTAMERHIDIGEGIGTNVEYEGKSRELVKFSWNDPRVDNFSSKGLERDEIKELAAKGPGSQTGDIRAFRVNTTFGQDREFRKILKQHLPVKERDGSVTNPDVGYALTRLFYGEKGQEETYVVFERLSSVGLKKAA